MPGDAAPEQLRAAFLRYASTRPATLRGPATEAIRLALQADYACQVQRDEPALSPAAPDAADVPGNTQPNS